MPETSFLFPDNVGRIFIIDDSSENLSILGELLADYKRNFALNGDDAIRWLASQPPPDLILLDVIMPGLDGFEVCRRIKSDPRLHDIPVIFITALADADAETRGFEFGAVDYITKPFNPAVVKARVKTHLELKHARASLAHQNSILEDQVAAPTKELSGALSDVKKGALDTIFRLARAAEYKDMHTGEHVMRMSQYSAAVARGMGFSEADVAQMLYAAPMHDIGKIGIPDQILLKTGKLSDDEWAVMRQHTRIGAKILSGSNSEIIRLAEEIALSHHEKWDGSGYPNALAAEKISLHGRIVAIADVFDALTTSRPYKDAFPISEAMSIIQNGRGKHFDPQVVSAFFSVEPEILKIKHSFDRQ